MDSFVSLNRIPLCIPECCNNFIPVCITLALSRIKFRRFPSQQNKINRQCSFRSLRTDSLDLIHQSSCIDSNLDKLFSTRLDIENLVSIIRQCGVAKALGDGKLIHQHVKRHGYNRNKYISNCLILMYADCGSMEDAQEVFDDIHNPNSFSYSILIKGYAQNGKLNKARHVFNRIGSPDVVCCNTLISAYAKNGDSQQALDVFYKMLCDGIEPNKATFLSVLEACSTLSTIDEAQKPLKVINNSKYAYDVVVRTSLINLYGKHRKLDEAWNIFSEIPHRDVVTWNAMITSYAQNGYGFRALNLFYHMQLEGVGPTCVTFVCTIDACMSISSLEEGQSVHSSCVCYGYEEDLSVGNALINMYGKCGHLHEARDSFSRISHKNVVSWTALLKAFLEGKEDEEAICIFWQMQLHGVQPNEITFSCAIDACANLTILDKGFLIHAIIIEKAYEQDVVLGTSLINMYGKCGLIEGAQCVFRRLVRQDTAFWNAMLTAYAKNGYGKETLDLFNQMETNGLKVNEVSFVCVLTVCSHMGWVEIGRIYFMSMYMDYYMHPTIDHFSCMVDLFGRAGLLEEAEDLIDSMLLGNLESVWTSLLAACRTHADLKRGLRAADHLSELFPVDPAPYIILADIYAAEEEERNG